MYRSTHHWRRLVNGYSGYAPNAYRDLTKVIARGPEEFLAAMDAFGIRFLAIHWNALSEVERKCVTGLNAKASVVGCVDETTLLALSHEPSLHPPSTLRLENITVFEGNDNKAVILIQLGLAQKSYVLTTPWHRPSSISISWLDANGREHLSDSVDYKGSKLLRDNETLLFQCKKPGIGHYAIRITFVLGAVQMKASGICEIAEDGFIRFERLEK